MTKSGGRLLHERVIAEECEQGRRAAVAPAGTSVTVNATEAPLGWLFARGLVTQRQLDAGERLRCDWERASLSPRVTMSWDAAPRSRGAGRATRELDLSGAQLDAKQRFDAAIASAGAGLSDILAGGLRRRGDARRRDGARLARARRQGGAEPGPRPDRGLLPDPLTAGVHPCGCRDGRPALWVPCSRSCLAAAKFALAERRIMQVVPAFIPAAVAAHCFLSCWTS
jgi:hypothetical protein